MKLFNHHEIMTTKEQPSVALGSNEVTSCPIGREGQPSCLFKHEIERLNKILSTLLSQSPDTPILKKLSTIIHNNPSSLHNDLRSLLPTLLRAIPDSPWLDEIKAIIIASKKIKTNISIGEWLDTRIISAILTQFEYNTEQLKIAQEQSSIAPYRFGGCFRYDDFEVYDDHSINCPCLSPSPDIDHLKWPYIKQAPFTHFIFNTCSRISTGQHFVSLITRVDRAIKDCSVLYFDSQHVGPYHNGEIPPDFHTRDFGNPFCNRFKNYTSHFDDWFDNLSKEANKDGYKIKLIHNMKTYQHNNYACGIYSLYHGVARAISGNVTMNNEVVHSVDDAMDQFLDKLIQHN